ncbi:MAG: alpha/beta fold hydrolase [Planctomycetales bacterium]|nr:alpha/beta fold hydrolase [Planctomycetales bacterium]
MSKRPILKLLTLAFILCLGLFSGCGSPYKTLNLAPADLFREKSKNAVNSSKPSWETRQTLRLMFLDESYRRDPQQVISELEQRVKKTPMPALRMSLAELSLLQARKYHKSDPQKAIVHYLIAAQQSYDYLFSDTCSVGLNPLIPSYRFMADIYNLAVSELVDMRANRADRWDSKDFDYEGMRYHFEVVKEGPGIWDPAWFNYLHNAYEIRVTGFANEYVTKGLGAPLVGIVEKPSENPHFGRFYPPRLVSYPVSALLLFDPVRDTDPPSRDIRLVFYNALETDSVTIQNQNVPLEANFTTPLGLQLRKTNPFRMGLGHLLQSDVQLENAGIYMMEPYRPDKIPVVMVHGLMSSPATWAGIFNDLRGDAQLRKKYQFWFFMYPTGLPIGYSASILRDHLNAVHAAYDPDGTNPNFNQMVLIGHSMGGLLSRLMVQDSGTKYWDYYFNEPFETISLDSETKQFIRNIAFFEHLPYVKRVIFIATPHLGSPMADKWYTGILVGMVNLPSVMSETTTDLVRGQALNQSVASAFTKKTPNSLTLLSPSSAFMKASNAIPLRPDVPYHSVIGTRKRTAAGAGTSDGIVPYESSHLNFAESEVLVPSGHNAHTHPLAIAEVKRILYEHMEQKP